MKIASGIIMVFFVAVILASIAVIIYVFQRDSGITTTMSTSKKLDSVLK